MDGSRILAVSDLLRRMILTAAAAVVFVTMIATGCTLFIGVVVRYVLHGSLPWTAELPTILLPWVVMGGVTIAAAESRHLGVDYVLRSLPPAARRLTELAMALLLAALMLVLALQAPKILQYMQYRTTPVLGWPASWAFYSVPLGMLSVAALALLRVPWILSGRAADDRSAG